MSAILTKEPEPLGRLARVPAELERVVNRCLRKQPDRRFQTMADLKVALEEVKSALSDNRQKIEKLYVPQKTKQTQKIEGSPAEVAKKLVDKLKNEVRVI